jgi:uncharacterized protein YdeI (YjbR/CyaY-like superfamily)
MKPDYPIVFLKSPIDWEEYLVKKHTTDGVWLKFAKKNSGVSSVTYDEVLEVALMFGWIDGQSKSFDDTFWLQKFTPRRKNSMWSKRNCEIAERLISSGRMQPSGLKQVEEAKKDRRWDRAYDSPENMVVPEDFLDQLSRNKKALAFFKTLNKTNTYTIAWRLQTAKKPETRAKRMKELLSLMANEQKLH